MQSPSHVCASEDSAEIAWCVGWLQVGPAKRRTLSLATKMNQADAHGHHLALHRQATRPTNVLSMQKQQLDKKQMDVASLQSWCGEGLRGVVIFSVR
jgi:hypothetical protein